MNYKQTADEIVLWLKNYATENKRNGLVVGVSGGVDSALVSTLCTMTGLPTYCVVMPCQSKTDQTDRGTRHIKWLQSKFKHNVFHDEINLTAAFEAIENVTTTLYHNNLGYANTKSRLRMITLYQVATCVGGLVVGTGNKVEDFGVGFFTKYGDGGVDISPIAGLTKTQVRAMAKELGVLDELVNAVPTDGLWEDSRSDEDQIGASYEELEWAMEFIENEFVNVECIELFKKIEQRTPECTARQNEVLEIYKKFHIQNKHKMHPIPTFIPEK